MPHVTIEMLPGRSEETKQALAEQLSVTVAGCVRVDPSHVSVTIREVPASDWNAAVYDRVMGEENTLYRKPHKM